MADQGAAFLSSGSAGSSTATVEGAEPGSYSDTIFDLVEPFPGFMTLLVLFVTIGSIWLLIALVPGLRPKVRRR